MGKSHFNDDVRDTWTVGIGTIGWDFWSVSNQLGKFSMETVISGQWWRSHQSLACKGLRFSDSVLSLGKMHQSPQSNTVWEDKLTLFESSSQHRTLDTIDGEPMEFEWNIFQGFTTLELVREVQKFMSRMGELEQFQGRIIFVSMLMTSHWEIKTMKRNILLIPHLCLYWSFLGPGPHCRSATKSKSSCRQWAISQKNLKDGSSSCRCSTASHGDPKTMNRNVNLTPTSFLFVRKDFHQEDVHSSDRKEVVFYLW